MLKKLARGLGVVLLLLVAVVAMQPSAFRIERTLAIQAPPEIILPHITSLRAMNVDMDQMLDGEFAKGLASLKALVETEATARR